MNRSKLDAIDSPKPRISSIVSAQNYVLIEEIVEQVGDRDLLKDSYEMAKSAHEGQTRVSGDEYINHPINVAYFYSQILPGDSIGLSVCLLHDVLEQSSIRREEMRRAFGRVGKVISFMVDALSKKSSDSFPTRLARLSEHYPRFFKGSMLDRRIGLIRLIDRFHNIQTIDSLGHLRAIRILIETREVLLPFFHANRLPLSGHLEKECNQKLARITQLVDMQTLREQEGLVKWETA